MKFSGDWCPLCQVLAQDRAKRWQGGLWSPLSWVLLSPISHLHCTSHFAPKLDVSHPKPSSQVFLCTAGSLPVPPHLPELEDASCADILGRGDLHWAVLPVLIELQDLHPQLHFARHLAPPAGQGLGCSFGLLGGFLPRKKGIKTSKHWAQSDWSSNKCTVGEHTGSSCAVLLNFPDSNFCQTSEFYFFPDSNTNLNSTFKLWSQLLPDNRSCQGNQTEMEDRRMKYDIVSQALKIQSIFLTFFISLPSLQPFPELNDKQPFL